MPRMEKVAGVRLSKDQIALLMHLAEGGRIYHRVPSWVWRRHGVTETWYFAYPQGVQAKPSKDFRPPTCRSMYERGYVERVPATAKSDTADYVISRAGRMMVDAIRDQLPFTAKRCSEPPEDDRLDGIIY